MRIFLFPFSRCVPFLSLVVLVAVAPAAAHVQLNAPNGGETLVVGTQTLIEWQVAIEHNTEDWDLWLSTTGPDGPWLEIAIDLPLGDPTAGSVHTFSWTIPDAPATTVRVRVRQDNVGMDYVDVSSEDLTIVQGALFEDGFETGDTSGWSSLMP